MRQPLHVEAYYQSEGANAFLYVSVYVKVITMIAVSTRTFIFISGGLLIYFSAVFMDCNLSKMTTFIRSISIP
jgi:hypothetical protein